MSSEEDEAVPLQRNSKIPPAVGFAMDGAAAGARFGTALLPEQMTIQGVTARKLTKALQKVRDIDIHDEWDETVHRIANEVDDTMKEVRGNTLSLIKETAEDVLRRTDYVAGDLKDKYLNRYSGQTQRYRHYAVLMSDLLKRKTKKLQLMCLAFFILFLVAWNLMMDVVLQPLDCSSYEAKSDLILKCYNVEDLMVDLQCDKYNCAVPWSRSPGDNRCDVTDCNCGGICHYCTQCLCTVGYGGSQYHVCKPFEMEGESLRKTMNIVIIALLSAGTGVYVMKYIFGWYTEYRSSVVLYEKEKETEILKLARRRKQQRLRDDIVGTKVEFFNEPDRVYHPDLVKAAVAQRLEDRACFYRPHDERPATVGGEIAQAALQVVSERVEDVRDHVEKQANPALTKLFATRYAKKSYMLEKQRKAKLARRTGGTLSALKANLGDPWLKEVEQDTIPYSGQLYDLYHSVEETTSPTPENLVNAMFEAPGIHASLPFLRRFLLREPARNQLPLTWPEFYSEIALAKDFIHQVRKGGADFTKYLTATTDNLWGDAPPKARPSQAAALLEIAKLMAPLMSGDNKPEGGMTQVAAAAAPYAIPLATSRPIPTKNEAAAQKRALLSALKVLSSMMGEDAESESDSSEESEGDSSYEDNDPLAYSIKGPGRKQETMVPME